MPSAKPKNVVQRNDDEYLHPLVFNCLAVSSHVSNPASQCGLQSGVEAPVDREMISQSVTVNNTAQEIDHDHTMVSCSTRSSGFSRIHRPIIEHHSGT